MSMCGAVALRGEHISAQRYLAGLVFVSITKAGKGGSVYKKKTLTGLPDLLVPGYYRRQQWVNEASMSEKVRDCDQGRAGTGLWH